MDVEVKRSIESEGEGLRGHGVHIWQAAEQKGVSCAMKMVASEPMATKHVPHRCSLLSKLACRTGRTAHKPHSPCCRSPSSVSSHGSGCALNCGLTNAVCGRWCDRTCITVPSPRAGWPHCVGSTWAGCPWLAGAWLVGAWLVGCRSGWLSRGFCWGCRSSSAYSSACSTATMLSEEPEEKPLGGWLGVGPPLAARLREQQASQEKNDASVGPLGFEC